MKYKIYLRIAQTNRGFRVDASNKPNYEPLYAGSKHSSYSRAYPTCSFALMLDIPDEKFKEAEQVAQEVNVKLRNLQINAQVLNSIDRLGEDDEDEEGDEESEDE